MRNNVCLDANLLVELLESRPKSHIVLKLLEDSSNQLSVSSLTCHIVMYICRKRVDINIIEKFLLDYKILSLSEEDVKWAMTNRRNADFEDALQIAIAIRNGCTEFITLDRELYEAYKNLPTLKLRLL